MAWACPLLPTGLTHFAKRLFVSFTTLVRKSVDLSGIPNSYFNDLLGKVSRCQAPVRTDADVIITFVSVPCATTGDM